MDNTTKAAKRRRYTTILVLDPRKIYEARIRMGLRQFELAAKAGITPQYLNDVESGRRPGRPEVRVAIAKALGQPLDDLCKPEDDDPETVDAEEA